MTDRAVTLVLSLASDPRPFGGNTDRLRGPMDKTRAGPPRARAPRPAVRKALGNEAPRTGRHAGRIRPSRGNHHGGCRQDRRQA